MDQITAPAVLPANSALSAASAASETRETRSTALASDFTTFLKLLTAQMRNQDPMQPIESTEFVAQLANFSTVEQLVSTNERLDTLAASAASGEVAALSGWIGLDVAPVDGSFRARGDPVEIAADPTVGATAAELEIVDLAGQLRARIAMEPTAESVTWNGRDAEGAPLTDETVRAKIVYRDGETVLAEKPGLVYGRIVALDGGTDGASLRLEDGRKLAPGDVAALRRPPAEGPDAE